MTRRRRDTYFTAVSDGARIHMRGCAFHMTNTQIVAFIDWLRAGRADEAAEPEHVRSAVRKEVVAE